MSDPIEKGFDPINPADWPNQGRQATGTNIVSVTQTNVPTANLSSLDVMAAHASISSDETVCGTAVAGRPYRTGDVSTHTWRVGGIYMAGASADVITAFRQHTFGVEVVCRHRSYVIPTEHIAGYELGQA